MSTANVNSEHWQ